MRNVSRFVACLLLFALVFSLVSCMGYSEDINQRINSYLAKEYPGREFAIIDYEKHNETSGRYEVNMRCLDDGVEFMMYMYSSIAVTDSYSVERANKIMTEIVTEELGKEFLKKFESITWHNIFADRATNYRFREITLTEKFSLASIGEIYEIKLASGLSEEELGETIYRFMYELCDEQEDGCKINRAQFVFKIDRVTYRFTTDSKAIMSLGEDGLVYYIIRSITSAPSSLREVEMEYLFIEAGEDTETGEEENKK